MEKSKTIGILGLGAMGKIIAKDLAGTFKGKVIYLVRDKKAIGGLANKYKAEVRFADVSDIISLTKALKGIDVVIHAVHHEYNLNVMKACLKTKTHYLDLGGLYHYTKKQLKLDREFSKARLTAVIGIGAAPGITNILAKYGSKLFDKINNIEIKIGYKDFSDYKRESPLSSSYSIQTILEEGSWNPAVFINGKIVFVEPISGRKEYKFPEPVGIQKPQYTIHSEIATLPFTLKARNVSFKIAFDDDFVDKVQSLKSLGFLTDKNVTIKGIKTNVKFATAEVLKKIPQPIREHIHEYEIIRVIVGGTKNNKKKIVTMDAKIEGINETIDKDTGVPPSIVAQMILDEKINKYGVYPPESIVPEEDFFNELGKRGIYIFMDGKKIN